MKKNGKEKKGVGCLGVSLQHLGDEFEMVFCLVAPRPTRAIAMAVMVAVLLSRRRRRGLGGTGVGSSLGSNSLKEHRIAGALHQIHDGLTGLLEDLRVVITLGHKPQETAADSVREVELVGTAGEDKCLEDGAHLDLQVREGAGLGLVEVVSGIAVEGEHGRRGLD